jgi:PAS domain S-box-containing protein
MIIGGLWILFSDSLSARFTNDIDVLTRIATVKGWFFILVTSGLLYVLIRNYTKETKDVKESLTESEKRYKELADMLPQSIFEADSNGILTFVNLSSYQMFGYTQAEFAAGFSVYSALVLEDRSRAENRITFLMNGEEGRGMGEYMAIKKDGTKFPVIISSNMVIKEGKITGLRGIIIDITERKSIEDQLRKLSRAVEQNPSSIIITDMDGRIEYVNPRFVEKTGYLMAEIKGMKPSILKSGMQTQEFYKNLWDTISTGEEWRGEFLNKKKDGTLFWEAASISAIRNNNGKMTHYIGIKEDISEKKLIEAELIKAKERAEESDKLKSEFLSQMSHEIRTPLNVILSYNSFLQEELAEHLNEDLVTAFGAVNTAGRRLFRTIDLILNMAEMQTGNIDVKLTDVNLYYILKGLSKEFEKSAREKKLELNCNNECEISPVINSDEYIISEVFQNLIDNAIKYTLRGKIDINISRDGDRYFVSVQDTGIGIAENYIDKIFIPFSQEDSGYSRKYEGNGLGLALVKNYLSLINAEIKVESIKGMGTKFIVYFN